MNTESKTVIDTPVKQHKALTVFTVAISVIPLLAVIAFILWRVLKAKGKSNVEIRNTILKVHISVVALVLAIAVIIAFFATSDNGKPSKQDAWICAQDVVKDYLKIPSSADFCSASDATIIHLGNQRYEINGYVDAQNSFGSTVRSYFTVKLTLTSHGYKNAECTVH